MLGTRFYHAGRVGMARMREAVLTLDDAELAALGIEELVSLSRAADLRGFDELECQATGSVIQVELGEPVDEDRLDALDYVDWWERVSPSTDEAGYIISFTAPALSADISTHADGLVGNCDPVMDEYGATVSFVGSQEAIRGTIDEYQAVGIAPGLRKLGDFDGRSAPMDSLTDRQLEVIQTAYDMGYYEVPREVSSADIAEALDLDPSTVAEHLQRAERNLLQTQLSSR